MKRLLCAVLATAGVFAGAGPAAAAPSIGGQPSSGASSVGAPSLGAQPSATASPAAGRLSIGLAIGLDGLKQALAERIDARLTTLATLTTVISSAQHLTAGHRATLSALVGTDQTRLTSLKAAVAGEQTIAALRADATAMVDDYRVYALLVPKVRLTIAVDLAADAQQALHRVHDVLAGRAGTARYVADLRDMQNQLDAASVAGVADALLATPAGADAKAIKSRVGSARSAVGTSRTALRKALADAQAARQLIRG